MATTSIPTWRLQDRLIRALDWADVSVQAMADELGVSRNTVSNYMHGRSRPNRATLRVWATRCDVPFLWLTSGEEGEPDTGRVTLGKPAKAMSKHPLKFAA